MTVCQYTGCGYDDQVHRPYANKRDGIPSATTIAGALDTGKSRSFGWAASLIAATTAVHHPDRFQGLVGMSKRAIKNGHTERCTEEKDGLCLQCALLRSEFDRVWTAKANLGSHIHHLALSWANGVSVDTDETTEPFMDALARFYRDHHPRFDYLERTVLYDDDRLAYRGTFDFIAQLDGPGDGRLGLLDIKTGGYWAWEQTLQLAGYRYSHWLTSWVGGVEVKQKMMPHVDFAGVLLLRPDGSYALQELPVSEAMFKHFLGLRAAWGAAREMEQWAKDNPLEGVEA